MTRDAASVDTDADAVPFTDGRTAPYIDRNHYFALAYPADWTVTELADSIGLVLMAPSGDAKWRARLRVNVRAAPRSQTLDRTLYLFRSDMLSKPGMRFEGQRFEPHACGRPAGSLAWAMLRDGTSLRVVQWFVAIRAGLIAQITASAEAEAYSQYDEAFTAIAASFRPLKALEQLALLRSLPAAAKVVEGKPAEASPAQPTPDAPQATLSKPAPAADADEPATTVAAGQPTPAITVNAAAAGASEIDLASLQPEPAAEPTPEPAAQAPVATAVVTEVSAIEPEPVAAVAPAAESTSDAQDDAAGESASADDGISRLTDSPAFNRIWVALDLAAKALVQESRKEARKHGLKICTKSLFESRAAALDSVRRSLARPPGVDPTLSAGLVAFLESKVAGRTRLARLTVAERCEDYAAACPASDAAFPTPAALQRLAQHLSQGTGDQAAFAQGLAGVDQAALAPFRDRLIALFFGHPAQWHALDPGQIDAILRGA